MTTDITFRSDMRVDLLDGFGSDATICQAAKVSTDGALSLNAGDAKAGLINYLVSQRHGSPFEHNSLQFYIEAPIFVWREFMRHRIGFSYNETSGRYRELDPVFWIPGRDRNLVRVSAPARPKFESGTMRQHTIAFHATTRAYKSAWENYRVMLDAGIASEVARAVLPVATYSSAYVTCNARSLMSFLSLRVGSEESTFRSYPQQEIELVALEMERIFANQFPLTYDAYIKNGRVAP